MEILLVSSTFFESKNIIENLGLREVNHSFFASEKSNVDLIITGIGVPAAMLSLLTEVNFRKYDLIINFGIAGSYSDELEIGEIVNIISDRFADIIIRASDNELINVFESSFNEKFNNLINNGKIINTSDYPSFFFDLKKVKAVTVNAAEKCKFSDASIETMEGAAIMLICKYYKKCFIHIRGISNIIGITKRNEWDLISPVTNYSKIIISFINKYC